MNFTFARFPGVASAERAVSQLVDRSIDPRQIRVMAAADESVEAVPLKRHHNTQPLAVAGGVVGLLAGLFAGAMGAAELGSLSPLATGAIGGGIVGAFLGAIGSLGYWRLVPRLTNGARPERGIVVGAVTVPERTETARDALRAADADRLHETDATVTRAAAAAVLLEQAA